MKRYRNFREAEEEYFRNHPEEIDDYIQMLFEEYAGDSNLSGMLTSLRMLARVKGITHIAEEAGMSRKGLQKALSEDGNPGLGTINAIIGAMGYQLTTKKIEPAQAPL